MIHLKHNQVLYELIFCSFLWYHLKIQQIGQTIVFDLVALICAIDIGHVSLAQMDATRQEPVVDRHNKRYLDKKGGNR